MLTTFGTYHLPTVKESEPFQASFADAFSPLQQGDGEHLTTGTGPLFLHQGSLPVTFIVHPAWMNLYYSSDDFPNLESALADFSISVLGGGLQVLKDTLPAVTIVGGVEQTYRTCNAIASGQYSVNRITGSPVAEVTMTFLMPSPYWTYSSGVRVRLV